MGLLMFVMYWFELLGTSLLEIVHLHMLHVYYNLFCTCTCIIKGPKYRLRGQVVHNLKGGTAFGLDMTTFSQCYALPLVREMFYNSTDIYMTSFMTYIVYFCLSYWF